MNKSALSLLAAVYLLSCAFAANAQEIKIGVGADVGNIGTGGMIYVPVQVGNLRIEPEFSASKSDASTMSAFGTTSTTNNTQKMGLGLYYAFEPSETTQLYLGARIGRQSSKYTYIATSANSIISSGTYIMPTLGAEYFFDTHISLGLTVSYVQRFKLDATNMSTFGAPSSSSTDYRGSTESHAALRYYF